MMSVLNVFVIDSFTIIHSCYLCIYICMVSIKMICLFLTCEIEMQLFDRFFNGVDPGPQTIDRCNNANNLCSSINAQQLFLPIYDLYSYIDLFSIFWGLL